MVGKYLIASYLYYEHDYSLMEDTEFDQLCKNILDNFEYYRYNHPHGYLLDEEALAAGTGHHIRASQYPMIVKVIAHNILDYNKQGRDYLKEIENA